MDKLMTTKTPRTDQLLELIGTNKLGYRSAFEEALELCESLETELSNRQSDIVKPITKSPEQPVLVDEDRFKQLLEAGQVVKLSKSGEDVKIEIPNQNADESPGTHAQAAFEFAEIELAELEKQNKRMSEALLKIAKRLEAGDIGEWTTAALARIARGALNKSQSTEEI